MGGRQLIVAWSRSDRLTRPVGLLECREVDGEDEFVFRYLKSAESFEEFAALPNFPDLGRVYRGRKLFPVISNRLMSPDRPDYADWVALFDLDVHAGFFDILERSGGLRVTDRLELLPVPTVEDGTIMSRFFVRGIRHLDGAAEAAMKLRVGDSLVVRPEPDNEVNEEALLLDSATGERIGYVPDYLVGMVRDLRVHNEAMPRVIVERVNRDVAPSMMVLVSMEAPCPPGYEPLAGPEYQPLVAA